MSSPVQLYDVIMIVVLVSCTLFGIWKGMVWQIASFSSLVLSAGAAFHLSGPVAPYLSSQAPWNRFLAMLILYLATSLGVWLLFRLVSGFLDRVKLREFDRQIGGVFGLAKGVLFCLVITFFCVTLSETARQAILTSRSGYCITKLIERANPLIPEEVRGVIGSYIDELDRKLDPAAGTNRGAFSQRARGRGKRIVVRLVSGEDAGQGGAGGKSAADSSGVTARRLGSIAGQGGPAIG